MDGLGAAEADPAGGRNAAAGGRKRRPLKSHGLQADASRLLELLTAVDQFLVEVWKPHREQHRDEAGRLEGRGRETVGHVLGKVAARAESIARRLGGVA